MSSGSNQVGPKESVFLSNFEQISLFREFPAEVFQGAKQHGMGGKQPLRIVDPVPLTLAQSGVLQRDGDIFVGFPIVTDGAQFSQLAGLEEDVAEVCCEDIPK